MALSEDSWQLANCRLKYASFLRDVPLDLSTASSLFVDALSVLRRVQGDDHPRVAKCLYEQGALFTLQCCFTEADASLKEALSIYEAKHGVDSVHPDTLHVLCLQGELLLARAEAEDKEEGDGGSDSVTDSSALFVA